MPIFANPTVWMALMDLGLSTAAATAVTATLNFIAVTAASMAASKLLQPKAPSFSDASLQNRNQTVRSPLAARPIVYGQCKVGGTLVYISTTGATNEYLHLVIALAGHEVEEIGDIYFNDELVLTGGGSSATGKYAGLAEIYKKLGSDTQTVETNLLAATSGLTDGKWTSDHRLRGIAYVYVRLTWDAEVFVGGIPNVSAIVKGKKVYDPRTSTTAYSANPALCLRDYLLDTRLGLAMDASEMDDTAFTAAANICDESVQVLPLSPATYENRYSCNGVLSTAETPDGNIGKLLSAMAGLVAYSGGKIVPYAGGYRIPTVSLTEKHFVGGLSVQTRTSARDRVNAVKGVFVSPTNNWQVTDFPSITSAVYYTEDNSIRYWRDVTLPLTTSPACAQRLGIIELRRARQEITLTARFRLEAMQIRAGDTVMISNTKLGWTNKVFEVIGWNFVTEGAPPQLAIEMTLRETDAGVYSWTVGDEIAVASAPNTTLPDPFTLDAPTNLTLVADGTTQLVQADGTVMPRIKVSWSAPSEEFIQSGGTTLIEYKQGNSTTYLTWSRVDGDIVQDYISSDVKIGVSYDVRLSGESYFKVATSYVTASITVSKDTTPPAIPTGLVAIVGTGKAVSLDWDDNTEPDFSEYGIYRNTSGSTPANANTDKIAEVRASRFVDTDVTLGTTYYYWINAYDSTENVSGFSSRVSAVPTYVSGGSVDPTAPATPSAPTFSSETTYVSSDGTSFARINLTAPAIPSGAIALDILYRKSGASDWIIGNQVATGGGTVSIDDLSVGIGYEFAARGVSNFGVLSAVSSVLSRTAPTNTTAPAVPSSVYLSTNDISIRFTGSATTPDYGSRVNWTAPSDVDIDHIEVKATFTDSDGATDYTWTAGTNPFSVAAAPNKPASVVLYSSTLVAGFVRVRSVSASGAASAWVSVGNANGTAKVSGGNSSGRNVGTATNTVAAGDDSRITGAAQKSSNLSDLSNVATARSNLGLGDAATKDVSALGGITTTSIITGGAVGSVSGIKYDNGATNWIAFYWDGSNVRAVVDGTLQGTIPNP